MRQVGLYLHIPFCVRKCAYCDFPSWSGREKWMEPYCDRVLQEIRSKARPDLEVSSVYIGGGTPSIYPLPLLQRLMDGLRDAFAFADDAEISMEMNPGTFTERVAEGAAALGVNRVSMGMQCAQPALLQRLRRIHTLSDVRDGMDLLRGAGIDNVNLDLMMGLPGQTMADAEESLKAALDMGCRHLSCYGLIVEEGTPLQAKVESGEWTLPDAETERQMYDLCLRLTESYGMKQYEISNFAYPGYACRHNLAVWRRGEYLGFGCSAAGMLDDVRVQNPRSLSEYMKGAEPERTVLTPEDAMFESLMLGLRLNEGVSAAEFERMHGRKLEAVYGAAWQKALRSGLLTYDEGVLRCTRRGMDVLNSILVDLLDAQDA